MFIKNVIFDLDGTLVDSRPGIEHSVDYALIQHGYSARASGLHTHIGPPIRTILQRISGETEPKALDGLEAAFRFSYDGEGWRQTVLREDAEETLSWLDNAGYRLYLVTNKPWRATQKITEHFGLTTLLAKMISPDSGVPPYSSKAAMIGYLMEEEGLSPSNSIVVGDTEQDLEAATEVGVRAVLLTTGYDRILPRQDGEGAVLINALSELKSIIDPIGGQA